MNIVRWYNTNRKAIWKTIIIIAALFGLIQLLNYYVKTSSEENLSSYTNSNSSTEENSTGTNSAATSNTSGVTGSTVTDDELDEVQELFDEFFGYCNSKELQSAYDMLTDDCKELVYPSLELFEANYYDNIFGREQKIYSFENWAGDIYLVTVEDDVLATGKTNDTVDQDVDYITIEDGKLNISTFIGKEEINKTTTASDITFVVESKETYMEYEVYNITVTNNSGSTICLASVDSSNDICLVDDNGVLYGVYNHELIQNSLVLKNEYTFEYSFKFYSAYVTTKKIEEIAFRNIFMDYINNKDDIGEIYVDV